MTVTLYNPHNKPEVEDAILIAFKSDGDTQFTSGWYDQGEEEYFRHDGEYIEISYIVGWKWKPDIEVED